MHDTMKKPRHKTPSAVSGCDACRRNYPKVCAIRPAVHQLVAHLRSACCSVICHEACRRIEAGYPTHLNRCSLTPYG